MTTLIQWPGRSHISTFVHTLHLLDLDQLEDWPEVGVQTFGPKSNLQHRLRCVEWSLYRLFELYDVKTTRDKLRPFFPPSTSLQSVNLRAALLRQLTDLKKDGVLGGGVLLRKTMLDECKGDKFEELLASFALQVLKKVLAKTDDRLLAMSVETSHTVPMILSYRKAIQRDLEKRKELELRTRQQQRNIEASARAFSEEAVAWKNRKAPAVPKNADILKRLVRENWIGDTEWVDTILHGVPPTPGLAYDEPQDGDEVDDASLLLTELEYRVRNQNARLAHWEEYVKTRQRQGRWSETESAQPKSLHTLPAANRFSRHQNIAFRGNTVQIDPVDIELNPRHAALITTLDHGLFIKPSQDSSMPDAQTPTSTTDDHHRPGRSTTRPTTVWKSSYKTMTTRKNSDSSSQGTVTVDMSLGQQNSPHVFTVTNTDSHHTPTRGSSKQPTAYSRDGMFGSPPELDGKASLLERTRASLAQFETPRAKLQRSKTSISPARNATGSSIMAAPANTTSDKASLLERTRQSMSFLTNVLDDNYQPRSGTRQTRARHTKSKSMYIPSQKPRLERAWSEESLASAAKDDSLDAEADYESVFKSRPRLAMSPNLSPARSNVQLDGDLEDALNKLTINSTSPDY